jgi:hypothetical protein
MVHLIYGEKCSVYIVVQALVLLKQLKAGLYIAESYASAQGSPTPYTADYIPTKRASHIDTTKAGTEVQRRA